jgi:type I restriction-modification system DNA methylase subunit
MSKSFDQGREEIAKLCKYFANSRQEFLKPGIKEAHVRQSLIDPLFEALGWDVANREMAAPQYREVIPEDSLEIEGSQKAPDYTFRIGSYPKFFTEAKKCGVNINGDPGPAYQLRRYGWSAKVPFSILTDFEELGVYDCSLKPKPVDKAGFGRIQYFRSEEYPDRWHELWDVFSREAVKGGAFDKLAATKRKRGTSEVDDEFLKEIEEWRDSLARNIAVRNQFLAPDDLNTAVQRTIDRIIFLRMAEDRGSEPYGQLLKLCEQPDVYKRFISKLCRIADEKYNSGLFHFKNEEGIAEGPDLIATKIQVDDKVFKPILQNLYFENGSPYHFGVMPVEMLGTVYERFLGKVIRLTPEHRAKVEEKPEVRKAGGVYYTPAYIVDYIVKNTVGKLIEGKSPIQIAGGKNGQPIRVLDMACGSGSFLLGAFQCLLDHCLKWYSENQPEKYKNEVYQTAKGEWRLAIAEKKRILTTHIFGVDIDPQAVEVSKLSLLLKVMEGETDETVGKSRMLFHQRALPNLSANIKCGNSLIASDFSMIPEDLVRINAFDWPAQFPDAIKAGGFDAIIGNPPYSAKQSLETQELMKYFSSVEYKCDPYAFFLEQGLNKLKLNGHLGFIVPVTWMTNYYYMKMRKLLIDSNSLKKIVLIDGLVFEDANVDTCLLFLNKNSVSTEIFEWVKTVPTQLEKPVIHREYSKIKAEERYDIVPNADDAWDSIRNKIDNISIKLGSIAKISLGMKLRSNDEFVVLTKDKERPDGIYFGADISRYGACKPKRFFNFSKAIIIGGTKKPEIHRASPKILIQAIRNLSLKRRIVAALESKGDCFIGTVNGVTLLDKSWGIRFILGIINSNLINTYFSRRFTTISLTSAFLGQIPIPKKDLSNPVFSAKYCRLIQLVDRMLILNKNLDGKISEMEKAALQNAITTTDAEIDRLVYELYDLSDEEIKIIEGR